MTRTLARLLALGGMLLVLAIGSDAGGAPGARTQVTIWSSSESFGGEFGGEPYAGSSSLGAMNSEQREVEVSASGEVRVVNIASTVDPVSVQLRDVTEPGATITEQRLIPGAAERDVAATAGLPAGPVRLLERRTDGSLAVLGEARLFELATRVATVDLISVGTAEGVTGKRERREISDDEVSKRLVEEFVITIRNTRAHPVEIVLREHLYRGQNWMLAFQSAAAATKEGPQQIALRIVAPPRGQSRVLYVVVYTW